MKIGVDLDGVLAFESPKWKGVEHIGEPIPIMLRRVKKWLKEGHEVVCFTARINNDHIAAQYVRRWLNLNGLQQVGMTCVKDQEMNVFWDDRAVCVERNTGRILGRNRKVALPCRKAT